MMITQTLQTLRTLINAARRRRTGRRSARALTFALALVFAVGLSLGPSSRPAPAHAASGSAPADLLNISQILYDMRVAQLKGLPAPLYAATPAQIQSLQTLEQAAVSATLADHGLPASDADAVQSWARADADAELWALFVQAIKTPAASRTADQQNAVDWLTAVDRREGVQAADAAGLEYVKWAGLDQSGYQSLLASNPSQAQLTAFLTTQSPSGYCAYRSPAPYGSEYTGYTDQTCYTPCTNLLGCSPPTPTYDQFVKWGDAAVNSQLFATRDLAQVSRDIAVGATFGGAAVAAGVVGVALSSALASVLVGSALQVAIFPFLAIPIGSTFTGVSSSFLTVEGVSELAGAVTASGVGFIAGVAIAAIAIAALQGVNVVDAANLPGKLATLIAAAPGNTPDLGAVLGDATQAAGLYALFVGATLPTPRLQTCDNSVLIAGPNGFPEPCLNAPAIPSATPVDPQFAIQAHGATATTYTSTLTWTDAVAGTTHAARLSGTWFVDQVSAPSLTTPITLQTLRIHYTDWAGQGRTTWLLHDPTNGYKFLTVADLSAAGASFDPSTCVAAGTCSYSPTIDYVGADGADDSAAVVPPLAPVVQPTSTRNPEVGSPVAFDANGVSPLGLTVTYQWEFEREGLNGGPAGPVTTCPLGGPCVSDYTYTPPITGVSADHTWTTAGTYHVRLTATDAAGHVTVDVFAVTVVAAKVRLSWPQPSPITYGTPLTGVVLNATATSGNGSPVAGTYAYSVDGAPVTPSEVLPAGRHTLQAHFAPSDPSSYQTPPAVTVQLNVDCAPLTITATDQSMTYGGAVPAFDARYSGLVNGETDAVVGGLICGAHDASGRLVSGATPAGTYAITCAGGRAANYTLTYQPGTLRIARAPLAITANDQSMTYGGSVPAFGVSYSGLVNGDTGSVVPGLTCGATAGGTPVSPTTLPGRYAINCTATANPANYDFKVTRGTLTIAPAPLTITATDQNMTYGGAVPRFDARYSGFVNGQTASASLSFAPPTCRATDATGSPVSPKTPAGAYTIACTGATSRAYSITSVTGTLTIAPAPLTITANDQTTPYGRVPAATWTGSGWVNGESASTLTTAPNSAPTCQATVNGGAVSTTTTAPGRYPDAISCQGAVDPNYTITYASGQLTINPLLSLDEQGLPSTVPHQATLDGATVGLPDAGVEAAYGSAHHYSFPATVIDASGTVYVTVDAGFSGTVTANMSDTATYQTMAQIVSAARASGGIGTSGEATDLTRLFDAAQRNIAAGDTAHALADLRRFADHVRAQSGKRITAATAQALLADVQLVYAGLGGTGSV